MKDLKTIHANDSEISYTAYEELNQLLALVKIYPPAVEPTEEPSACASSSTLSGSDDSGTTHTATLGGTWSLSECARLNTHHLSTFYHQITKLDFFQCELTSLPSSLPTLLPNLSILFCMKNQFTEMPTVVGECKKLQMISFKSNRITAIHPDSLQAQLRWLILTDNQLNCLPETIGRCTQLKKLMLSGNRLTELPTSIVQCTNLQLIRLASNQLSDPCSIRSLASNLPHLAWIALSDNPFLSTFTSSLLSSSSLPGTTCSIIPSTDLQDTGEILGSGASGITRAYLWTHSNAPEEESQKNQTKIPPPKRVAVKSYTSQSMTSDGNPQEERRIALLTSSLTCDSFVQVYGITEQDDSLVMEYLQDYHVFAKPPSMQSCTRDVYEYKNGKNDTDTNYTEDQDHDDDEAILLSTPQEAHTMITKLLHALLQLHSKGICHGDFYGHNVLISTPTTRRRMKEKKRSCTITMDATFLYQEVESENEDIRTLVKLTDFGASFLYDRQSEYGLFLERVERRALGHLVTEVRDMLLQGHRVRVRDRIRMEKELYQDDISKLCVQLEAFAELCLGETMATFADVLQFWERNVTV